MFVIFSVFYILIAAAMIVLILLQNGAGADAGSGFRQRCIGHGIRCAWLGHVPYAGHRRTGDAVLPAEPRHGHLPARQWQSRSKPMIWA
jgi:hypothetical protein